MISTPVMPKDGHTSAGEFKPAWWLPGGHPQTLWASLTRKIPLSTRAERLELPDGDFTKLDWVGDEGPIVVVLPGLQGDLNSPYVRGLLRACVRRGWRGVLLNHRGRGEPNRLPHSYHCGMTCDIEYLVRLLREREPSTPIAVVGYSLGANICLKWLGDSGRDGKALPIEAAVGVSSPFSPGESGRSIETGFSRVYQRHLLRSLWSDLERKAEVVDTGLGLAREEIRSLDTFFKFDDRVTSPLNGFDGAEDYYEKNRCDRLLAYIRVPTLILSARNDPLVPARLIPDADSVSDRVTLEITESGGHVGFVSGRRPWKPHFWLETRIPEFVGAFF